MSFLNAGDQLFLNESTPTTSISENINPFCPSPLSKLDFEEKKNVVYVESLQGT